MPQRALYVTEVSSNAHNNEAVMTLLARGVDPNVSSPGGATPLIMAAGYGQTEIVKELLAHGADAEAGEGINALWAAAGGGAIRDFTDGPPLGMCFPDTIRALLDYAPDLRLKSSVASRWVEWLAYLKGCEETVRKLPRE